MSPKQLRQAINTAEWSNNDYKAVAFNLIDLWESFASVVSEEDVREMLSCYVQGATGFGGVG